VVIYKITNLLDGKVYIGQDSKDRDAYFGSGLLIRRAIKKYGRENFRREVLEVCHDKPSMDAAEQRWILELQSQNPAIGYNIAFGGEGGSTRHGQRNSDYQKQRVREANKARPPVSAETKEKMSLAKKGQEGTFKGKEHSADSKEKNRQSHLGKVASIETRQKLSDLRKGKPKSERIRELLRTTYSRMSVEDQKARAKRVSESLKGHRHSEETKRKISEAARLRAQKKKGACQNEEASTQRKTDNSQGQ
jgi:group I intron endonuclease